MYKINRKNAIDHLRRLQKRLIINDTSAQAMYTKFNDRSSKIFDLHRLSDYEPDYLNILLQGKHLIIEIREHNDQLAKNLIQHLRKINNSNQTKIKDLNVDALYLGYPYITGTSGKIEKEEDISHVFRAPLILWKANLEVITPSKLKI
jgi:cell fate (sporulation/competence/biofilm development) regulator YlbF (YheA/YmcA/DUF963 family)